ncbi:zinc finger BED domain-containing protein RICESLEEPER 2-like [Quercus lobata]|uniref:zinc finger BED domain-containing protein RICESLEEPER 2-like n=1 Tax=Quercus lobata TaxID=97700 RepID=UPI0012485F8B|nr:zinc finger BED domain-containing protein RICESLEEPER 2-like [Quercus lobata]
MAGASTSGTTHLKLHIAKSCPSAPKEASPSREGTDIRKQVLVKQHNKARSKGISSPSVLNEEDQKASRRDLARMVILHEYPLAIVDHVGFRDFVGGLRFIRMPSPHDKYFLSKILLECISDRNIDLKLFAITVDNASNDDAHILNLVVQEGLNVIGDGIEKYQFAPTNRDWEVAQIVCEKLGYFHKVTELLSGTAYPTANHYFPSVFRLKLELNQWLSSEDELVKKIAAKMLAKFDKYWSDVHDIMSLAIVLDPRYKLMLLTFYFNKMYGSKANEEIDKVKNLLFELFAEYDLENIDRGVIYSQTSSSTSTSSATHEHDDTMRDYDLFVSNATTNIGQMSRDIISEFELYTSEKVAPRTEQFDVLGWWKCNASKYPTLQHIARDILAIPMTTIASKSAFSTCGRLLSPHRSHLHHDTLEALMCGQNWL